MQATINGKNEIAEVQFYFRARLANKNFTLALVSIFSEPDHLLFESSSGTVFSCQYRGADAYQVIEVTSILSVVSMVPTSHTTRWHPKILFSGKTWIGDGLSCWYFRGFKQYSWRTGRVKISQSICSNFYNSSELCYMRSCLSPSGPSPSMIICTRFVSLGFP